MPSSACSPAVTADTGLLRSSGHRNPGQRRRGVEKLSRRAASPSTPAKPVAAGPAVRRVHVVPLAFAVGPGFESAFILSFVLLHSC
jgi:hypothetical protein